MLSQEVLSKLILGVVRWAVILRHPRLAYWNRSADPDRHMPNPANPRTANDKFFWRKVFDRSPILTEVSDKLLVRDWLLKNDLKIDAPAILWTGADPADIPDDLLAGGVVVKPNHGSAMNIMLDSAPSNRQAFNRRMRRYLRRRHGARRFESAYFDIERKLFVEKLIPNITTEFKVYTFGDRIERLVIVYDRFEDAVADVWLPDGRGGWIRFDGAAAVAGQANRPLPSETQQALEFACQVGAKFDHMRVDILSDGDKLWFSELTVFNMEGIFPSVGHIPTDALNEAWDLRRSWFMKTPQTGWRAVYADVLHRSLGATD